MKLFVSTLLPLLATASSLLPARQTNPARVASVTTEGPACPQGSFNLTNSIDGQRVTVIFDRYRANFQLGVTPPGERDLDCNRIFHLTFPIGCTKVTLDTQYRGFAQITQGGVTGHVAPSYVLSTAKLDGVNEQPTKFDSRAVKDFLRNDKPTASLTVRNSNGQAVQYESRTRLRVITTNSEVAGVVYMDAIDLALTNQRPC
jgi:hypothetical protein